MDMEGWKDGWMEGWKDGSSRLGRNERTDGRISPPVKIPGASKQSGLLCNCYVVEIVLSVRRTRGQKPRRMRTDGRTNGLGYVCRECHALSLLCSRSATPTQGYTRKSRAPTNGLTTYVKDIESIE